LAAIAIIPSAPVLVPDLVGAAAVEIDELRTAVLAAAAALPSRWVAVGGGGRGAAETTFGPGGVGTFAGFGVDVRVQLSPQSVGEPADLPLCALIAGWVRGQTRPDARVEVRVCGGDVDAARAGGARLRAEIDAAAEQIGILVIADGANTLTAAAPGGYQPRDADVQRGLDDALGCGDAAAVARLPEQVVGRAAFAALAGLAEPGPRTAKELYRGAPCGVGYFAGIWQP
jgi:hypothetical protein